MNVHNTTMQWKPTASDVDRCWLLLEPTTIPGSADGASSTLVLSLARAFDLAGTSQCLESIATAGVRVKTLGVAPVVFAMRAAE